MDSLKRLFNSMHLEKPSLGAPEGTMKIALAAPTMPGLNKQLRVVSASQE